MTRPVLANDMITAIAETHDAGHLDQEAFTSWAREVLPPHLNRRACDMHGARLLTPEGRARRIERAIQYGRGLLSAGVDPARVEAILVNRTTYQERRAVLGALFNTPLRVVAA